MVEAVRRKGDERDRSGKGQEPGVRTEAVHLVGDRELQDEAQNVRNEKTGTNCERIEHNQERRCEGDTLECCQRHGRDDGTGDGAVHRRRPGTSLRERNRGPIITTKVRDLTTGGTRMVLRNRYAGSRHLHAGTPPTSAKFSSHRQVRVCLTTHEPLRHPPNGWQPGQSLSRWDFLSG